MHVEFIRGKPITCFDNETEAVQALEPRVYMIASGNDFDGWNDVDSLYQEGLLAALTEYRRGCNREDYLIRAARLKINRLIDGSDSCTGADRHNVPFERAPATPLSLDDDTREDEDTDDGGGFADWLDYAAQNAAERRGDGNTPVPNRPAVVAAVEAEIASLGDTARLVFYLTYERGMSSREIARELGIGDRVVREHVERITRNLRSRLDSHAEYRQDDHKWRDQQGKRMYAYNGRGPQYDEHR